MIFKEQTCQHLLDKIGVMVLSLDERGRISMINAAGCKLLGYEHDELIGRDWCACFLRPQDRDSVRKYFFQIIAGEEDLREVRENYIMIRSGTERLIRWHNSVLRDDDGNVTGVLSTGEDITVRRQAEENVYRSERRYRRFVEHVPDALLIFDSNGKIIDVNVRACWDSGYTRDELLELSINELDLSKDGIEELKWNIVKANGAFIFEGMFRRKDGTTYPAQIKTDSFVGDDESLFICVVRNISDRLHQQRRLQDKRDLLRVIIDSIPDSICVKDGRGRWLLANISVLHLFGLETVNYRGKTDTELAAYTPLYKEAFLNCCESDDRAWQRKEPSRSNEMIPVGDGSFRVFDVCKVPIFHGGGRRKVLVVIGRDITEQKRIEEKYRKLFEQSPIAFLTSTMSGKILAVNQAVTKTLGYEPEEIVGRNITEFLTPKSLQFYKQQYPRFLRGDPTPEFDYEVYKADGSLALIQVSSAIIRDDRGNPVSVQRILLDVTRQRRIEEQIRESEARYRQLFERAPVGIVYFDTDLHVTDCNDNYLKLMHADRDRMIGLEIRNLRDKRVLPVLEATLEGKEGHWKGLYQTTVSNKRIYVSARTAPLYDSQGNIQGGVALVEDMSLQQQAQEEKFRLMSAIDQASETIVITDTRGIIEYVNPAFEKMTGYSAAEAHGLNPRVLQSGRHDKEFYKEMWQTLRSGRVWKGHIINKRKDGALFEEDATISPVRNQEGEIINYVAVKRDVTEEVALKKQLNQAMKMEAIGTLAGGIAHDFNNILSAVLGYAEMVELQLDENEPARKDVGQIIAAGQRATDLIRQILTFSRQEEEELRPVKLQFVIKEALKLLRSSLPTSIELQQEVDPGCGPVLADPIRIHQVLMNLCTNAKQAMEGQQGTLRVRLAEFDIDSGAFSGFFPTIESGPWLDLEVSDTGMGMEEQVKERIFDPFFTTKKKGQGTGLGLSVVHGIVKSHNGEITVESEPGRGTTFHIYLPIVETEVYDEHQSGQIILPQGTEHILLVDDEPLLVEIMERFLTMLGYKVKGFIDSREAMAWYGENADRIDLVITDMTMPHLTGAELAREILAQRPEMPIVLCTGYSEVMDAEKAMAMGIRKFIAKPVDNSVLAHSVREALDVPG